MLFAEDVVHEHVEFRIQIVVAHRPFAAADRVLDIFLQHAAVLERELHVAFVVAQRVVDGAVDAIAQRHHLGIAHHGVAVFLLARRAEQERHRGGMEHAELAFEAHLRRALAGELQHEMRHGEVHLRDFIAGEAVLLLELHAAVDRGMNDDAAGERLVGIEADLEGLAQILGDLGVVVLGRHHVGEAALGLDHLVRAGEVLLREQRRGKAVLRGASGMEALAMRAEHLAEAGGLRAGDAERPGHLLLVEAEKLAAGRGRAEHARRAGDVPAGFVVLGADRVADAAFGFDAEDEGVQQLSARHRHDTRRAGRSPRPRGLRGG